MSKPVQTKALSFADLQRRKRESKPFACLTAYDATTAKLLDEAGMELLLVGDSLAMTVLGHPDTLSVTVDEMLHHTKAVVRGTRRALVVADAPFMSYHVDVPSAVQNTSRFIKEGGADAVKLEGASPIVLNTMQHLVSIGIPVVAHLGLTPQFIKGFGGFKAQGKTADAATELLNQAKAIEAAGASAVVLECIPEELAALVTQWLSIPTIGIGAGRHCDSQILVIDDLLGRYAELKPRFVRHYMDSQTSVTEAVQAFQQDCLTRQFPNEAESFRMKPDEWGRFQAALKSSVGDELSVPCVN